MCTMIAFSTAARGAAKGAKGWFPVNRLTAGYDHATYARAEHAVLLDFTNYDIGTDARVAVELDLASGRALLEQLRAALDAAEATGQALASH